MLHRREAYGMGLRNDFPKGRFAASQM